VSRIGNKPVVIPAGVTVDVKDHTVTVKGPKGELSYTFNQNISLEQREGEVVFSRPDDSKENKTIHGTTRAVFNNMVVGVTEGFQKELELIGVGYRAQLQGKKLVLNVGYSHPVEFTPEEGVEIEVPSNTKVIVKGYDKQKVGELAANIRGVRPPEPYKGNPKQGGRIYVRIRKTEKNILTVLVEREDIKDGSRYYWDPEYNRTFKLLDTPVITDNNGNKIAVLKATINPDGNLNKGIYGRCVDIYLEKEVPEELVIDLGRVKTKDEIYNTGKIYLKRE